MKPTGVPKILIVDDETGTGQTLMTILRPIYQVMWATNVDEAVDMFKKQRPNLVTMDLRMPGKSGLEGIREIRVLDPTVPIIVITGYGTVDNATEAIKFGVQDFVTKPFNVADIVFLVKKYLRHEDDQLELSATPVTFQSGKGKLPIDQIEDTINAFIHNLSGQLFQTRSLVQETLEALRSSQIEVSEDILQHVRRLSSRLDSISYVFGRFRKFLGKEAPVLRDIALNDLLIEVCDFLKIEFGERIKKYLDPDLPKMRGDKELIWHLIENLLRNGLESLNEEKGGFVTASTAFDKERDALILTIVDRGDGIPYEYQKKMFDLNFTTKPKGLGIGLYLVKRATEAHKGEIDFQSIPGKGTYFRVILPRGETKL